MPTFRGAAAACAGGTFTPLFNLCAADGDSSTSEHRTHATEANSISCSSLLSLYCCCFAWLDPLQQLDFVRSPLRAPASPLTNKSMAARWECARFQLFHHPAVAVKSVVLFNRIPLAARRSSSSSFGWGASADIRERRVACLGKAGDKRLTAGCTPSPACRGRHRAASPNMPEHVTTPGQQEVNNPRLSGPGVEALVPVNSRF